MEGREAGDGGTAPVGKVSIGPAALFVFPGLVSRCRLTADEALRCGWVGILGDSASRLGKPWGAELVPGSGVGAQRPRGPSHYRVTAGSCWSRPPGASGELPQVACVPPSMPQTSPCLTFPQHYHLRIPAPHAGSVHGIPAAPLHSPALKAGEPAPRPGSCGFSSWQLWGILCLG